MSKKNTKLRQENPSNFNLLPIAFIISVVPLIVFMKVTKLSAVEIQNWLGGDTHTDFFNYYKSQWLIVGTVLALVFFLVYSLIKKFEIKKSFLYIPTLIYAVLIILSTVASKNPQIALKGFIARYEGMLAWLCYLALMLVIYNLVKTESQIRFLLWAFLLSAAVLGIIGLFQFFNMDMFRTDFGKRLILPKIYHQYAAEVSFRFEETYVYSTLSNPNYIGSYMALAIPMAFAAFLYFKKLYLKIGSALLIIVLTVGLFGSRSRAGLVGLAVSIFIAIVLFRKVIFKRKLLALSGIIGLLVIFFGINFALNGLLTDRIFSEFTQLSDTETQFFDLQDITFEDNTASVISSTGKLTIENKDDALYFYDTEGKELKPNMKQAEDSTAISFAEPLYKDYNLTVRGNVVTVNQRGVEFQLIWMDGSFALVGINKEIINEVKKAEAIGFVGQERLGSARGYIWSRIFPMLKKTIFIGHGPDVFSIEFPQNDYIGKIRAYGTPQMIVDKPHNMYLQIAVNTGVLSLLAVLVLWGFYIVQSIKLYIKNIEKSYISITGACIFMAICAYLAAGLANDSAVGIAPIFWVLLGLGFVCNEILKKQRNNVQK